MSKTASTKRVKTPSPEVCCPRCEALARAHGWTPYIRLSVKDFLRLNNLSEDSALP